MVALGLKTCLEDPVVDNGLYPLLAKLPLLAMFVDEAVVLRIA